MRYFDLVIVCSGTLEAMDIRMLVTSLSPYIHYYGLRKIYRLSCALKIVSHSTLVVGMEELPRAWTAR